jgi:hypothetical protein
MAVDGLKGGKLPPKLPSIDTAKPATQAAPVAKTEAKKPAGPADAMGKSVEAPKVETSGKMNKPELSAGSGSRLSGDWLSGGTPSAADLYSAAVSKLLPGMRTELVGPPAGATVAKTGDSSFIGLKDDYFDPKASYETNLALLKKEGIPRFALLSSSERAHETAFADAVQKNPEHFVEGAEILASKEAIPTYEVDAEKRQYDPYGGGKKPANPEERALRLAVNHALHPSAVAVARLAFLKKLDELEKLPAGDAKKSVFVTNGGCAAGKGSLSEILKRMQGDLKFGAVWDAAGEGDSRENSWILDACASRGIKATFGYGAADPTSRYYDVLKRSEDSGRVVDVLTFTSSYVQGAKNMKSFLESPEFKAAEKNNLAAALTVDIGAFNVEKRSYADAKPIADGSVPNTPNMKDVFGSALGILDKYTAARTAEGKSNDEVLQGALAPVAKFAAMGMLEKL